MSQKRNCGAATAMTASRGGFEPGADLRGFQRWFEELSARRLPGSSSATLLLRDRVVGVPGIVRPVLGVAMDQAPARIHAPGHVEAAGRVDPRRAPSPGRDGLRCASCRHYRVGAGRHDLGVWRGHERIAAQSEKTVGIDWVHGSPLRSRIRRSQLTSATSERRLRMGDQTSGRTLRAQLSSAPILTRAAPAVFALPGTTRFV